MTNILTLEKRDNTTELIPIPHKVPESLSNKLALAEQYKKVGMSYKARKILKGTIKEICKENKICIQSFYSTHFAPAGWKREKLKDSLVDIPSDILEKIKKISDKNRLYIFSSPNKGEDPVIIYELPYTSGCGYIEIARWE